jgi:hypothetical protein
MARYSTEQHVFLIDNYITIKKCYDKFVHFYQQYLNLPLPKKLYFSKKFWEEPIRLLYLKYLNLI